MTTRSWRSWSSWQLREVEGTGIPRSVVHRALKRLAVARLFDERRQRVNVSQAEARLRARRFTEDQVDGVICRWGHPGSDLILDAKPSDASILGLPDDGVSKMRLEVDAVNVGLVFAGKVTVSLDHIETALKHVAAIVNRFEQRVTRPRRASLRAIP
jgi:hypothetical protein